MSGGGTAPRTGVESSTPAREMAPSGRDVAVGVVVTVLVVSGATAPAGLDAGVDGGVERPDLVDAVPSLPFARLAVIALLGSSLLLGAGSGVVADSQAADVGASVGVSVQAEDREPSRPIQRRAGIESVGYDLSVGATDPSAPPAVV